VSKAADRSRPISTVTCLSSAAVKTPSSTSSSAVSVECPFMLVFHDLSLISQSTLCGVSLHCLLSLLLYLFDMMLYVLLMFPAKYRFD